jgi:hypothetical protein
MSTKSLQSVLLASTVASLLITATHAQGAMDVSSNGAPPRGASSSGANSDVLSSVPFGFVENRGQWDNPARFIGTRGRARVYVEATALTVAVSGRPGDEAVPVTRFVFEGAHETARAEGVDPLAGVYNFYTAGVAAPTEQVERFGAVLLRGLYTGIDVRLREHQGRLEYDVLLAPGAALDDVVVRCEGISRLELAGDGRLLLHTAAGEVLTQSSPTTWAELPEGGVRALACRYVLLGEDRYGYALPERAADLPVVIDPGLEWSTFLGGTGFDNALAIERDPQGRLIVAGSSDSLGWALPGAGSPFPVNSGTFDSYVVMIDPALSGAAQVVWWTFFGGSSGDWIWDIATNAAGQVFAAGDTDSFDFPVTAGAFQSALAGSWDAFITVLDPATGTLVHSTYYGGSGWDSGQRILVEEPSFVTIAGGTESASMTMTPSAFDSTFGGNRDAYFAMFDLAQGGAAALVYSTFVGGSGQDAWVAERQVDIARAANGVVTLVTSSFSSDFPVTPNAYHSTNGGSQDPVLVQIDPAVSGSAGLLYGTFLGTSAAEGVSDVELDPTGAYIITGFTYSGTFPTTPDAPYRTFIGPAGFNDAWLIKFDLAQANPLVYSTYLSGSGFEGFDQLALDAHGTAYGVGFTGRTNLTNNVLPVTCNAFDKVFDGPYEGFILAITPAGNGLSDVHYLSFFGGTGIDNTVDLVVESTNGTPMLVIGGSSRSVDLPTTPGALQTIHGGDTDAFVSRIRLNPYLMCVASASSVSPAGAHLCASGPTSLVANSLVLAVTGLPPASLGYFLMSTTEVAPFSLPAPSQGKLCLGGTIVRFAAFVQIATGGGTVDFQPDLLNTPPPGAPLAPGDTAIFQYWHRDVGGASNTSSGVAVTFD